MSQRQVGASSQGGGWYVTCTLQGTYCWLKLPTRSRTGCGEPQLVVSPLNHGERVGAVVPMDGVQDLGLSEYAS